MKKSLVSVIVPVYNGERYLADALDSIFAQDYRHFEVIVVDDGSTDGSIDIIRSYKLVRYIYQENQGNASARNSGIAATRGEFLAFLDQDDLWTPNKLTVQVDYLLKHPHIGYVLCHMHVFLEPEIERPSWIDPLCIEGKQTIPARLPGALVMRKTIIEKIGNFDSTYRYANDADWFFRANNAGIRMETLSAPLLHKRIHQSNLSYETEKMRFELMRAVKMSITRQRNHQLRKKES